MSGYLEVKYPFKSNLGLNPFKSWKRQWCILRPSPTCSGSGSLAVYCSEAGAPAGSVELPSGCVVRRAKSRTRPHAFAVFSSKEPRKPRVLLAAQSLHDAQAWMEKIRDLLNGSKWVGTEALLKDSYSVTVLTTELSRKCGMAGDCLLTVSSGGLFVSRAQKQGTIIEWKHVSDVGLVCETTSKNKTCVLTVDSDYQNGGGELKFSSPLSSELTAALKEVLKERSTGHGAKKLSKSEGDLRSTQGLDSDTGEIRRSSWYSGPSEVSLDDIDLIMSKEAQRIPSGQLSRCSGAGHLAPTLADDSMSDRRSLVSLASGIYEEIPDLPPGEASEPNEPVESNETTELYCHMSRDVPDGVCRLGANLPAVSNAMEEPTYESVVECVYATMRRGRRHPPPPLPPRLPFGTSKSGSSWNCRAAASPDVCVTRHGSLGSLPLGCVRGTTGTAGTAGTAGTGAVGAECKTRTLPKPDKTRQTFSVFRKRLKSDSRVACSPKSDTLKENKDVETKKKKFDFTPTRDIFKSFKVSRRMKSLKITPGLGKGEAKSCEFLDSTEHVSAGRCARSEECLDDDRDQDDMGLRLDDPVTLALPQEIVDLIIRGREQFKIRLKESPEGDYLPMSPIVPPPVDTYMVMSPRANLA